MRNPIIDRLPREAVRDPALVRADGLFHCYHTTAAIGLAWSNDLVSWEVPDGQNAP